MIMRSDLRAIACLVTFAATVSGCASSSAPKPTPGLRSTPSSAGGLASPEQALRAGGPSRTVLAQAAVQFLGSVPYDNLVLPLVSPDGRYVATQTGEPPLWESVLAESWAIPAAVTQIQIYDVAAGLKPGDPEHVPQPALLHTMEAGLLLGRACDGEGFLVESQREDGARWIGKVSWSTGQVAWLAQDSNVNAFASLGRNGRIAWSRRAVDQPNFELVVRHHDQEWTLAAEGGDWLMPVWGVAGNSLFALRLIDGALEVKFGDARSRATFLQTMRSLPIGSDASVYTAYQAMAGQATTAEPDNVPYDQLVFFHPALARMAMWRPLGPPERRALYLKTGSIAALVDEDEFALVSTGEELVRLSLSDPKAFIDLVGGTQIPRATPHGEWPYVLLSPGDGHIMLLGMRLMPHAAAR